MTRNKQHIRLLLSLYFLFASVALAPAQNEKMKGVQIFRTALNTTWTGLGDKFIIGIYGESSVFFVLSAISRARKIDNSVVFVKKLTAINQVLDCNMVFVPSAKKSDLLEIRNLTKGKQMLIITEDATNPSDCDINLISNGESLSYEINKSAINKNLTLSDKLLSDASKIY